MGGERRIKYTNVASRQQGLAQSTGGAGGGAGGGDRSASHARLGTAGAVQQPGPTPDHHLFCKYNNLLYSNVFGIIRDTYGCIFFWAKPTLPFLSLIIGCDYLYPILHNILIKLCSSFNKFTFVSIQIDDYGMVSI